VYFYIKKIDYAKTKYIFLETKWWMVESSNRQWKKKKKKKKHIDWIRAKLENSERGGFTSDTKEQILKQSKSLLNGWIQTK